MKSNTKLVIVTGRDKRFLDSNFQDLNIDYAAEFGSIFKENNIIQSNVSLNKDWMTPAKSLLQKIKLDNTFVEEKDFSLVFHFKSNSISKLSNYLSSFSNEFEQLEAKYLLEIVKCKTSMELKPAGVNKSHAINHWINKASYDFILAVGNDQNDEFMFKALPEKSLSIKVGYSKTVAQFIVSDYIAVRKLLQALALN